MERRDPGQYEASKNPLTEPASPSPIEESPAVNVPAQKIPKELGGLAVNDRREEAGIAQPPPVSPEQAARIGAAGLCLYDFTEGQRDVLDKLAEGQTLTFISMESGDSMALLRGRLQRAREKMGLPNAEEAIVEFKRIKAESMAVPIPENASPGLLTAIERQTLEAMLSGTRQKDLAAQLNVDATTISQRLRSARAKLDVAHNRAAVAVYGCIKEQGSLGVISENNPKAQKTHQLKRPVNREKKSQANLKTALAELDSKKVKESVKRIQLSGRQRQVLFLTPKGLTYSEIAAGTGLSESTISDHVQSVYRKLGVNRLYHVAVIAYHLDRSTAPPVPEDIYLSDISEQKQKVLTLACQGKTPQEISQSLSVTKACVKKHISQTCQRFGVSRLESALPMFLELCAREQEQENCQKPSLPWEEALGAINWKEYGQGDLSPVHEIFERVILYLVRPEFRVKRKNAGGYVKQALGLTRHQWDYAHKVLSGQLEIIEFIKNDPNSNRTAALRLDIPALARNNSKPYVTERVLEAVRITFQADRIAAASKTVQSESVEPTKDEAAKKSQDHERREIDRNRLLKFDLRTASKFYRQNFTRKEYEALEPLPKLLLAVGVALTFDRQQPSIEKNRAYLLRMLNRGKSESERYNDDDLTNALNEIISKGFLSGSEFSWELTDDAVIYLNCLEKNNSASDFRYGKQRI